MIATVRGRTALVTGASSGLGKEFATQLARRGANLVIVARREDRLRALADDLSRRYGISVHVIPADLSVAADRQRLFDRTRELGVEVDVLINNAGLGAYGQFLRLDWETEQRVLDVDVVAVTHLTKLFASDMAARGNGHILLVSSTMAYQGVPTYAVYSAAKAYVLAFGEAIAHELRGAGVRVCVTSPGMTETEFLEVAGQSKSLYQRATAMSSADVARQSLEAMLLGKRVIVPGAINATMARSARMAPRALAVKLAGLVLAAGQRGAHAARRSTP